MLDSLRFVLCARPDCRRLFFLCRHCDRGDRYCTPACATRARQATIQAAGRRYQQSWRGRLRHAARQARYRARRENVTHQTSQTRPRSGIVAPPPTPRVSPAGGKEDPRDAEIPSPIHSGPPHCIRCGRPGRWLRHVTLAHLRPPRSPARR